MEIAKARTIQALSSRVLRPIAALLLVVVVAPAVALAHAEIASSTPASGATVAPGLTQVVINFSEDISVDQSNAQISTTTGQVSSAQSSVDRANRKLMTIQTPALTPGKYTVKWHAVTEDDNGITDGTISFTVSQAASATPGTTGGTSGSTSTPTTSGVENPASLPATGSANSASLPLLLGLSALVALAGGVVLRRHMSSLR